MFEGQIQPFSIAFPCHMGCQTPNELVKNTPFFLQQVLGRLGILHSDGYLGCMFNASDPSRAGCVWEGEGLGEAEGLLFKYIAV